MAASTQKINLETTKLAARQRQQRVPSRLEVLGEGPHTATALYDLTEMDADTARQRHLSSRVGGGGYGGLSDEKIRAERWGQRTTQPCI